MKKGYLSAYNQGSLRAVSDVLTLMSKLTAQRNIGSDDIFFATAFQAGIDEFLLYDDHIRSRSEFISSRTRQVTKTSVSHFGIITNAFSPYLPNDWLKLEQFRAVSSTALFIGDLMDAISMRASLLSTFRLPDLVEIEELIPAELYVPLSHMLSSFTAVQNPSPIPQKVASTDDIRKYNDILSGDLFSNYVHSQASLDDAETPLEKAFPAIVSEGRKLFLQNRDLLGLRNASVNILQMTPKLIDAVFGKLPGALAEVAAKLGISFLEDRRRLVIYDFHEVMYETVLKSNLLRAVSDLAAQAELGVEIDRDYD
jgi:hypothetical protein